MRSQKILVLPQGTERHQTQPLDKTHCRQVLHLKPEMPIVGHLGTLFESGAKLLFEAMKIERKERPDALLILIGRHKLRLNKFAGIEDFTLETREIARSRTWHFLAACDLLLLPMKKNIANNGRWLSKFNLYLASRRLVISTPISDINMIFEKEKIGILAEDNPHDFSRAILRLLKDQPLQNKLGEKGKTYGENV